jgi:hypothetical protein
MTRGPYFIEREVFTSMLAEIQRLDGASYEDVATAYGDMSRPVVAWLAQTSPDELKRLYNRLGWKSSANARQFHLAAMKWFEKYHPNHSLLPQEAT